MVNKIWKVFLVFYRNIVKLLRYINKELYMKMYSRYLKYIGIQISGTPKFISNSAYFDGADYKKISLGKNIVISREVMFLTHDYSIECALNAICENRDKEAFYLKDITIGDNCFIGARVSILPGTRIGNNVIIGASSVVKGNIPNDSIVVGNPCKIIGNTKEWAKLKMEIGDYNIEK